MNNGYALIKDGLVQNVVVWNGEGDIFSEFETYEIPDGVAVGPGYTVTKKGSDYTFAAPVVVKSPEQIATENKFTANSEYDRASSKITALQQQIDDEDYSSTDTEESVKARKTVWTNYRKSLRAYISAGDGTADLPKAPDA